MKLSVRAAVDQLRPFSRYFIERPRFATVIPLVMIIAGVVSLLRLPMAQYPEVTPPVITVQCAYPGASTHELMQTVAEVIEDEVNGVERMLFMSSTMSDDGSYRLGITFDVGTDRDVALMKVQSRVQQAMSRLPVEVRDCGINVSAGVVEMIGIVNVWSRDGGLSRLQISDYVNETLRPELQRVPDVGLVATDALRSTIRVWIDPLRCAAQSIGSDEIIEVIRRQNVQAALGTVGQLPSQDSPQLVTLRSEGRLSSPEEFGEMIVKRDGNGSVVRLKDIARIEVGPQSYRTSAAYNNRDAVTLYVFRTYDCNAVTMMDGVRDCVRKLERTFPGDLEWDVSYDATRFICASVRESMVTLVMSIVLVALVCWLFMRSWRATLIPVAVIPVSVLATFTVMAACGYSLNALTMFGLILAIGTVVDDAIVVVERVQFLIEKGLNAKEAAIHAMQDVTGAVIATTLVLLGIFLPTAFLTGMTSMLYRQFAITISAAVTFSTVCALTLSPALCALLLKPEEPACGKRNGLRMFEVLLDRLSTKCAVFSGRLVARPVSAMVMLTVILLWSVHLGRTLPDSFVPTEDRCLLFANVHFPDGCTRPRTERLCRKLADEFRAVDGVAGVTSLIGEGDGGECENLGYFNIMLRSWQEREQSGRSWEAILEDIRAIGNRVPAADFHAYTGAPIPGLGSGGTVSFGISSNDSDWHRLMQVAERVKRRLDDSPLIKATYTDSYDSMPYCQLTVNRAKCESYQVPVGTLFSTLQHYIGSYYVNDVNLGSQVNRVVIQADERGRDSVEAARRVFVKSQTGAMVPVDSLVSTEMTVDGRWCTRYNKRLITNLMSVPKPGVSTGDAMREIGRILAESLPADYFPEWQGATWHENREQGKVLPILALAVLFGYLFLVAQYESWLMPVPVMLSVVVAILGAFIGLWCAGLPTSVYSRLGMILLIGLAAKNAILIVEFSKEAHDRDNLPVRSAAAVGVIERFRAVLMTAFTFVLGVLPLVWATGAGANARRAIGVTAFSGMLASSLVGILFVPVLFAVFQRLGDKMDLKWRQAGERDSGAGASDIK